MILDTSYVIVKVIDTRKYELVQPFSYTSHNINVYIPAGFITDFASVPRLFWALMPPNGRYTKAAIIHDYMYHNGMATKKDADLVFKSAMKQLGVPKWKAEIMYFAVRIFGRGNY